NINDSLEASKTTVKNSVEQLFAAFEQIKLKEEPEQSKPIYEQAKQARAVVEELETYINELKQEFEKQGGGYDEDTGDLVRRKNADSAPHLMINGKRGAALKDKINDTREKLLSLLSEDDRKSVAFSLEAKDPEKAANGKRKWEDINFGSGTPLTAAMTTL